MAVIHFVPCHRQASFFPPSVHYLRTRIHVSVGHSSLPLWPRPTVLQGVGGQWTTHFGFCQHPPVNQPGHSTPPPGKLHKRWQPLSQSGWGGSGVFSSQNKLTLTKKYTSLPVASLLTSGNIPIILFWIFKYQRSVFILRLYFRQMTISF